MGSVNSTGAWQTVVSSVVLVLGLSACAADPAPSAAASSVSVCAAQDGTSLAPASGVLAGVNLDWEHQTLQEYGKHLGRRPAVVVSFASFPLSTDASADLEAAF